MGTGYGAALKRSANFLVIARSVSDEASGKHLVIPGRRDSGEPGIFFSPARFPINAPSALSGMTG
jgi:hypothetical protein